MAQDSEEVLYLSSFLEPKEMKPLYHDHLQGLPLEQSLKTWLEGSNYDAVRKGAWALLELRETAGARQILSLDRDSLTVEAQARCYHTALRHPRGGWELARDLGQGLTGNKDRAEVLKHLLGHLKEDPVARAALHLVESPEGGWRKQKYKSAATLLGAALSWEGDRLPEQVAEILPTIEASQPGDAALYAAAARELFRVDFIDEVLEAVELDEQSQSVLSRQAFANPEAPTEEILARALAEMEPAPASNLGLWATRKLEREPGQGELATILRQPVHHSGRWKLDRWESRAAVFRAVLENPDVQEPTDLARTGAELLAGIADDTDAARVGWALLQALQYQAPTAGLCRPALRMVERLKHAQSRRAVYQATLEAAGETGFEALARMGGQSLHNVSSKSEREALAQALVAELAPLAAAPSEMGLLVLTDPDELSAQLDQISGPTDFAVTDESVVIGGHELTTRQD